MSLQICHFRFSIFVLRGHWQCSRCLELNHICDLEEAVQYMTPNEQINVTRGILTNSPGQTVCRKVNSLVISVLLLKCANYHKGNLLRTFFLDFHSQETTKPYNTRFEGVNEVQLSR